MKVRQGAQYENAKPTVFVTKYFKTNYPKTFVTIPPGFFTNKHNPNPSHEPLDPSQPNIAFGHTLTSPKKEIKYTYGQIKKKPGHKADIKAKAKTYIPMVLDYLECKISLRDDAHDEKKKVLEETQRQVEAQIDPVDLDFDKQLDTLKSPTMIEKYTYYDHKRHNVLSSEAFRSTVRTSMQGKLQDYEKDEASKITIA